MTSLFHRQLHKPMPIAVSGDGIYITDQTGKRYLDACGGAAVSCLGHNNQAIKRAIAGQLESIAWAHTGFFSSSPAEALGDKLASESPGELNWTYLVSGGSEAVEASIKLARQYHVDSGQSGKSQIIARRQSYHGSTLGALAAGGNMARRTLYTPLLSDAMHHISPCHYWRWAEEGEGEFEYGQRVANQLEDKIIALGAEKVAAFIAEPVVGATMGAVPAVEGYFQRIRDICKAYDVLLIFDEIMCGMGRTGSLFASEHDRVIPDIVCIAKGLGAGYQPIGAMICTTHIYETIKNGSGHFLHGHTYLAHPVACAAALEALNQISTHDMLRGVREKGAVLMARLTARFGENRFVGDIRGRGLFIGIELVGSRNTKEPVERSWQLTDKFKQAAFDVGLMIYPMSGTIDGRFGNHILLAPPFIISDGEIDQLVDKLEMTFKHVLPT